jgi:hypothetical protein
MCPLCISVAAVVGLVLARTRRRAHRADPARWRLTTPAASTATITSSEPPQ